jgi:hypothetical protein
MHALGLFAATLEKRLQGSAEELLVHNLVRSIDALDRSFNVMLDVSRLDAGTIEPSFQRFPLRDLFRRLHMHFAGQAEQSGLGLRFSPGGKSVTSDPQLLERLLGNLIQNAIKYTRQGGIVVVARTVDSYINVEVWDTGVGIQASELPAHLRRVLPGGPRRARARAGLRHGPGDRQAPGATAGPPAGGRVAAGGRHHVPRRHSGRGPARHRGCHRARRHLAHAAAGAPAAHRADRGRRGIDPPRARAAAGRVGLPVLRGRTVEQAEQIVQSLDAPPT